MKLPPRRGRPPKGGRKEYERRVVGFVLGSITEKRKASESCGYISWVAVAEDFQRWVVLLGLAIGLAIWLGGLHPILQKMCIGVGRM